MTTKTDRMGTVEGNTGGRVFIVTDANGAEWARYCYPMMAAGVAARCNALPPYGMLAPFKVEVAE